ncbi:MAG: DNA methyltransferase, partial [Bacteroidetes bacterium]|nr:DNA methyltransferase [Bacteroidota bacterium]
VKHIHKKFAGQQGIWSNYVQEHLLPRLNGFELLMASYAMAHLQLDLLLKETGATNDQRLKTNTQRLRVYLTNSLEESHPDTGTLFANWLSSEANEANRIKRDAPVMCVIGNPPYSGISSNNGEWISKLIDDYKYVDGEYFNERKHWLNDDYVKFIRYGQHFIEKNGSGVLAFINPHGFLDNPTFRGMRWNLLKTYDKIYTLDLHGNAKKKETAPDGSADVNVFDIMQGVSINIFIKTGKKKTNELGKVFQYDLFGKRDFKYDFLFENSLKSIVFNELRPEKPNLFFVPKQKNVFEEEYFRGFKLNEFFPNGVIGTQTGSDKTLTSETSNGLKKLLFELYGTDVKDEYIQMYQYRPFEKRYMYFISSLNNNAYPKILIPASYRSRYNTTKHLIQNNIALLIPRQIAENDYYHCFLSTEIADACLISNKTKEQNQVFPLYLYPEKTEQLSLGQATPNPSKGGEFEAEYGGELQRVPNLNMAIVDKIAKDLQCLFVEDDNICVDLSSEYKDTIYPTDILDYIYAVLHSPSYREKYKEFLKIDFPRVPYPKDLSTFQKLTNLGSQLRQIHLLESDVVENYITQYTVGGSNMVEKIKMDEDYEREENGVVGLVSPAYRFGRVYINETQYFANVPLVAWEFYIGGYQPAQKWLKDRKGRALGFEDILHYQKIIVALTETDRLMKEIDKVGDI